MSTFFGSTVHANRVVFLVDEIDALHALRAPRGAADFVHQFQEHPHPQIRRGIATGFDTEMQHRKALMGRPHEHCHTKQPARRRQREQVLHPDDFAYPHSEAALMLMYFRHPIGIYGLLNAHADAVLVNVEKKQLFQRSTLFRGQFRRYVYWDAQRFHQ
jgi:hypothetical protein